MKKLRGRTRKKQKLWGLLQSFPFTRIALGSNSTDQAHHRHSLSVVACGPGARAIPRAPPAGTLSEALEATPRSHHHQNPLASAPLENAPAGIAVTATGLTPSRLHGLLARAPPAGRRPGAPPPLPRRLGPDRKRANLIRIAVAHGGRARVGGVGSQPLLPCHRRPAR